MFDPPNPPAEVLELHRRRTTGGAGDQLPTGASAEPREASLGGGQQQKHLQGSDPPPPGSVPFLWLRVEIFSSNMTSRFDERAAVCSVLVQARFLVLASPSPHLIRSAGGFSHP